jgi:hypothetical protein
MFVFFIGSSLGSYPPAGGHRFESCPVTNEDDQEIAFAVHFDLEASVICKISQRPHSLTNPLRMPVFTKIHGFCDQLQAFFTKMCDFCDNGYPKFFRKRQGR